MIDKIIELDKFLFLFLNSLGSEKIDPIWIFISNQNWMFIFLALIIIPKLYFKYGSKTFYYVTFILLCFGLTDLIHLHIFKNFFLRLRPCWDPEISNLCRIVVEKGGLYGFVSGHAANSTAIVTLFLLRLRSKSNFLKISLITWLFLVSFSRIYLGKHYPLDVIFGCVLGLITAYIFSRIMDKVKFI